MPTVHPDGVADRGGAAPLATGLQALAAERSLRVAADASLRHSYQCDQHTDAEAAEVSLQIAQLQAQTAAAQTVGDAAAACVQMVPDSTSVADFNNWYYIQHNQRRQEHLCSLNLDLADKSVLEVGAGIGDHTTFFLDRGCRVVVTEGRRENFAVLEHRYPHLETHLLDMEDPRVEFESRFDIVYCYGLLYHLKNPAPAIAYMARNCSGILLLELCVTPGEPDVPEVNAVHEPKEATTQATSGHGCRPHRQWVFRELRKHFEHVYLPSTQPWHREFPLDWTALRDGVPSGDLTRAVFVASREPLHNELLQKTIPDQQRRH